MKRMRPVIAVVVGASLVAAGAQAQAAAKPKPKPKPPCQLVKDASGDGNSNDLNGASPFPVGPVSKLPVALPAVSGGSSVDAMDITSADFGADKKNVTVVIRVKKLATSVATAPTGIRWAFGFTAEDMPFTLMAHSNPLSGVTFDAAYVDPTFGGSLYSTLLTGKFDLVANEVHITAPTSLFAAQATIKPGTKLSNLYVNVGAEVDIPDKSGKFGGGGFEEQTLYFADTASSTSTYTVGTATCVTPGK